MTDHLVGFSKRLNTALEKKGLPVRGRATELAKTFSVTTKAASKWLNGEALPDTKKIIDLAIWLDISVEWLLTGNERTTDNSNVRFLKKNTNTIPVLDFVQAGLWRQVAYDGMHPKGYMESVYFGSKPKAVFALTVEGDSMEPDFKEGDELIVDAAKMPYPGCFVIAQNGDYDTTFKKYRVTGYDQDGCDIFELVPLNDNYPKLKSSEHPISIIGVVVRHARPT